MTSEFEIVYPNYEILSGFTIPAVELGCQNLKVLIIKSEDYFYAQGLELDILGFGNDEQGAIRDFNENLDDLIEIIAKEPGKYTITEAPSYIQDKWNKSYERST